MDSVDKRYSDRIDSIENIQTLIEEVLKIYEKPELEKYKILEIGYEDFNVIVETKIDNYFLKIFRNSRDDNEVENMVERIIAATKVGVSTPIVYKNPKTNKYWTEIKIDKSRFRLCLMQHINGQDFFSLHQKPNNEELLQIAQIAAQVSKTDYKPTFVYDSWAITSFLQEFEKKEKYLKGKDLKIVREVYDEFSKFDYNALPKSFVHGDMMSTNMLKDKNEKIWLIDFSVSNFTARLNEIIVICGDLGLIINDKEQSVNRLKLVFETWAKLVDATKFEIESFEMLYKVANAINIMNTNFEIETGNTSDETMMHLEAGRFGINLIKEKLLVF